MRLILQNQILDGKCNDINSEKNIWHYILIGVEPICIFELQKERKKNVEDDFDPLFSCIKLEMWLTILNRLRFRCISVTSKAQKKKRKKKKQKEERLNYTHWNPITKMYGKRVLCECASKMYWGLRFLSTPIFDYNMKLCFINNCLRGANGYFLSLYFWY